MKFNVEKELASIVVALLPMAYLLIVWNTLPEIVPIHWNIKGEVDGTGSKYYLLAIVFLLPTLSYLIFVVAPFIDPKGKLSAMGNKLNNLKFMLTLFMSILAIYITYAAKTERFTNPSVIIILGGCLFTVLGNYLKTIKPNYFIGIRTPWTLHSNHNWKLTHNLSGKIWVMGGLIIIIASFFLKNEINIVVFLIAIAIMVIAPVIYSYKIYYDERKFE